MNKIDYNSQQFKWAKEIMQEKNILPKNVLMSL